MKIKLKAPLGISEKGKYPLQCISFFPQLADVTASDRVFVMCDGISGHAHSEMASSVVSRAIGEWMTSNVDFSQQLTGVTVRRAVVHAQEMLDAAYASNEPSRYPMGTTLAMLVVGNFGVAAAHIGNTRLYHVRPASREILYRSRDHSLVNDLFVAGRLTRAEVEASKKKNVLTRAMLPSPCDAAVPDVAFITDVNAGDYFVICCDGITGALSDKKLKDVLCNSQMSNAQKLASIKMLTDTVPTNHSVLLIEVESVDKEDGDHLLVNTERMMCDKMVRRSVILTPKVASTTAAGVQAPAAVVDAVVESADAETACQVPPEMPDVDSLTSRPDEQQPAPADVPAVAPTSPLPAGKKSMSKRLLSMIIAALLLVGAIAALMFFNIGRNSGNEAPAVSKSSENSDRDVIVHKDIPDNNVVPEEGLQPFDNNGASSTGSNVAVTPAARVDYPLPTGSNVKVPREKYDPYSDDYEDPSHYKNLEDEIPKTPDAASDAAGQPAQAAQPAQPAKQSQPGSVPPPKQKVSNDPTSSNRNVAVPPPPARKHNFQVP